MCRLQDNSYKKKSDIKKEANDLIDLIKDRTLESLEKDGIFVFPELLKDTEDITKDQKVIISENDAYKTNNIMGFLGYASGEKTTKLVISSRFCEKDKNDYFLQYLLEKVMGIPNIISLNVGMNLKESIFDILELIFPFFLKKALRKGLFRAYIRNEYNECNVKGTIDLSRHIKINTPFIGKIAFSQRELSYDNPLMELVRHTIEYIKTKPYGKRILKNVQEECRIVIEATKNYEFFDRQTIILFNRKKNGKPCFLS
ncbi:MAG: hypothetical protein ACI4NE_08110 [Succinivibrio sp.]